MRLLNDAWERNKCVICWRKGTCTWRDQPFSLARPHWPLTPSSSVLCAINQSACPKPPPTPARWGEELPTGMTDKTKAPLPLIGKGTAVNREEGCLWLLLLLRSLLLVVCLFLLGTEPAASYTLGKHSVTESHLQALPYSFAFYPWGYLKKKAKLKTKKSSLSQEQATSQQQWSCVILILIKRQERCRVRLPRSMLQVGEAARRFSPPLFFLNFLFLKNKTQGLNKCSPVD